FLSLDDKISLELRLEFYKERCLQFSMDTTTKIPRIVEYIRSKP
uniref:Uncharacterized protein n=1 Tax=Aegilops tauschii subsp. strangulata TaxID=200361 RepID=A0A453ICA6_AEGTS